MIYEFQELHYEEGQLFTTLPLEAGEAGGPARP